MRGGLVATFLVVFRVGRRLCGGMWQAFTCSIHFIIDVSATTSGSIKPYFYIADGDLPELDPGSREYRLFGYLGVQVLAVLPDPDSNLGLVPCFPYSSSEKLRSSQVHVRFYQ